MCIRDRYIYTVPGNSGNGKVAETDVRTNEHLVSSIDKVDADSCHWSFPLLYSSLNITMIIQSLNLTDAITNDSFSNVYLVSSVDTIHADSSTSTPPLLYFHLNIAKITRSLNLTNAITDDSYSNVRLS